MASSSELQARIEKLKRSRANGFARVSSPTGESVEYRSVAEINAAIAADERELASLQGTRTVRGFRFVSDKAL